MKTTIPTSLTILTTTMNASTISDQNSEYVSLFKVPQPWKFEISF